jgi:hypothetical protein
MELTPQQNDLFQEVTNSATLGLDPKRVFFSELNLSLAMPYKERVRGDNNKTSEVCVKVCDENVNQFLKITTESERGALSPKSYDVLSTLLHIGCEQMGEFEEKGVKYDTNSFPIYFTYRQICEHLNLSADNSQGIIKEAIKELRDVKLTVTGHVFNAKTKQFLYKDEEFSLLTRTSRAFGDLKEGMSASAKYVIFDRFIIEHLSAEFGFNRDIYLKLRGKERRAYAFLTAKRHNFGNAFAVSMDEFSSIIGDNNKRKDNKKISANKVLKKISNLVEKFDFSIKSIYGTNQIEIFIEYETGAESKPIYQSLFYKELDYFYGSKSLLSIGIEEADYLELEKNLERFIEKENIPKTYNFKRVDIPSLELAVDLALWQIIKTGYSIDTSRLTKLILKSMLTASVEWPKGYRLFIKDRNKEKRRKETKEKVSLEILKKKEKQREQEEMLDKNFKVFFNEKIKNNQKVMKKFEEIAKENLSQEEDLDSMNPIIRNEILKSAIYNLVKEDYNNSNERLFSLLEAGSREIQIQELFKLGNAQNEPNQIVSSVN